MERIENRQHCRLSLSDSNREVREKRSSFHQLADTACESVHFHVVAICMVDLLGGWSYQTKTQTTIFCAWWNCSLWEVSISRNTSSLRTAAAETFRINIRPLLRTEVYNTVTLTAIAKNLCTLKAL